MQLSGASWASEQPHGHTHSSSKPRPPGSGVEQPYVSPLEQLVSAAKAGDTGSMPPHANTFSDRAVRLAGIAESAAGNTRREPELVR